MFDIGFSELTIILLIGLLVIGPERLPEVARKVGLYIGKAKRFVNSVRSDIEKELRTDELEKMLQEQKQQLQDLKGAIESGSNKIEQEIKEEVTQIKEVVETQGSDAEGPFATLEKPQKSQISESTEGLEKPVE